MLKYKAKYWYAMRPFVRRALTKKFSKKETRSIIKSAKAEYLNLLNKADNIGSNNPMASNLYLALLFLSFLMGNRDKIKKDDLEYIINESLFNSKILVKVLSGKNLNNEKDLNRLKKTIYKKHEWEKKYKDKYPETWEFNFDDSHEDGFYYYFTKCPIAKFFKDNNIEDLTHLFCELDHKMLKLVNANLYRDKTLANGDNICDFWIVADEIKNPK